MNNNSEDPIDQTALSSPIKQLMEASLSGGNLVVFTRDSFKWSFYFSQGKLLYATNSLKSFERLEGQLRRVSKEVPSLNEKVRSQLRLMFDETEDSTNEAPTEYRALTWLVSEGQLSKEFAIKVLVRLMQEVLEAFIALPDGNIEMENNMRSLPNISCAFDLNKLLEVVSKRLQSWHDLGPTFFSPYQSPYLVSQTLAEKRLPVETVRSLSRILRGYNLRQLGAMMGRDELTIAKQLLPLVRDGAILLRDPIPPFNLLPRFYRLEPEEEAENLRQLSKTFDQLEEDDDNPETAPTFTSISQNFPKQKQKTWKITCIDDSQAMLNEIERLLDSQEYEVSLINDSLKALMKLASIRPDLILLDVGMPNVDGYQLCSLVRKTQIFKETPVVMVTGHKGLLDRARARMAGATDYLTKPFAQDDLLNMVMRHLL
jgi:twitching motility two-component system response regulator PilG